MLISFLTAIGISRHHTNFNSFSFDDLDTKIDKYIREKKPQLVKRIQTWKKILWCHHVQPCPDILRPAMIREKENLEEELKRTTKELEESKSYAKTLEINRETAVSTDKDRIRELEDFVDDRDKQIADLTQVNEEDSFQGIFLDQLVKHKDRKLYEFQVYFSKQLFTVNFWQNFKKWVFKKNPAKGSNCKSSCGSKGCQLSFPDADSYWKHVEKGKKVYYFCSTCCYGFNNYDQLFEHSEDCDSVLGMVEEQDSLEGKAVDGDDQQKEQFFRLLQEWDIQTEIVSLPDLIMDQGDSDSDTEQRIRNQESAKEDSFAEHNRDELMSILYAEFSDSDTDQRISNQESAKEDSIAEPPFLSDESCDSDPNQRMLKSFLPEESCSKTENDSRPNLTLGVGNMNTRSENLSQDSSTGGEGSVRVRWNQDPSNKRD